MRHLVRLGLIAFALGGCDLPTEPRVPTSGGRDCPFMTVCPDFGNGWGNLPTGPTPPPPPAAVVKGRISVDGAPLVGNDSLMSLYAPGGHIAVHHLRDDLTIDTASASVPAMVDSLTGQYVVELDSAWVASGRCHGALLFSAYSGASAIVRGLVPEAESCLGEVTGSDVDFPPTEPVSVVGTLTRAQAPVDARVSIVFRPPVYDGTGVDALYWVAAGVVSTDGSFHLEGRVAADRCDRLELHYRTVPTASLPAVSGEVDLGGCGARSVRVELPS